jgi:hypothetical protein
LTLDLVLGTACLMGLLMVASLVAIGNVRTRWTVLQI